MKHRKSGIIRHKESKVAQGKLISSKLKHELKFEFKKMIETNQQIKAAVEYLAFINGLSYKQVYDIVV